MAVIRLARSDPRRTRDRRGRLDRRRRCRCRRCTRAGRKLHDPGVERHRRVLGDHRERHRRVLGDHRARHRATGSPARRPGPIGRPRTSTWWTEKVQVPTGTLRTSSPGGAQRREIVAFALRVAADHADAVDAVKPQSAPTVSSPPPERTATAHGSCRSRCSRRPTPPAAHNIAQPTSAACARLISPDPQKLTSIIGPRRRAEPAAVDRLMTEDRGLGQHSASPPTSAPARRCTYRRWQPATNEPEPGSPGRT